MFTIILFLIVSVICGILLFFYHANKKIKQSHIHELHVLEQSILLNKSQINFREKGLDQYHFLKYNLEESLVMQLKIKLN